MSFFACSPRELSSPAAHTHNFNTIKLLPVKKYIWNNLLKFLEISAIKSPSSPEKHLIMMLIRICSQSLNNLKSPVKTSTHFKTLWIWKEGNQLHNTSLLFDCFVYVFVLGNAVSSNEALPGIPFDLVSTLGLLNLLFYKIICSLYWIWNEVTRTYNSIGGIFMI